MTTILRRSSRAAACATALAVVFFALLFGAAASVEAQLINEVIADNRTQPPLDVGGGTPDMVELYNDSGGTIVLGGETDALSYALTDSLEFDQDTAYFFPRGRATFSSGGRLVVFCDGNQAENQCELHASFSLASDGSEPVVLWGPEVDGRREIVDRVFLPPLRGDVSFGRFPDGAGGANLEVAEHLEHFVFYPPGRTSFGSSCANTPGSCPVNGGSRRLCSGAPNLVPLSTDNVSPRVDRVFESTNAPAAGEPLELIARVRDDGSPIPPNIAKVEIVYRVKPSGGVFGPERSIDLELDASLGEDGVLSAADRGRPLDLFSLWSGSIPGQDAGSRVEFFLRVTDEQEAVATRPRSLCHETAPYSEGDGPCDREFGPSENGCVRDSEDETCVPDDNGEDPEELAFREGAGAGAVVGLRYFACTTRSTYKVEHAPVGGKARVVINEVVPAQAGLLLDPSEREPCSVGSDTCDLVADPDCCHKDEDFIELYNGSDASVDLSGCFLSDSYFQPQLWKFPAGSILPAGAYVIVWLDRDGSRCPNPDVLNEPCFWECPDPNVESKDLPVPQFHTNFAVDADGDQVFLFDTVEEGLGLIHGIDFGRPSDFCGFTPGVNMDGEPTDDVRENQSLALFPDGDPRGEFVIVSAPTPGARNSGGDGCNEEVFRRGDATADGGVDISDGVSILNFLFTGGDIPTCLDAADSDDNSVVELSDAVRIFGFLFLGGVPPEAPGPNECGADPTEDALGGCGYPADC